MCKIVGNPGPGVAALVAILKDDEKLPKEKMTKVRDLTDCPACILAAIRQSGIWEAYVSEPCDINTGEAFSFGDAHNWNGPTWEIGEMPQFLGFSYKKEKAEVLAENRRREIGIYTENY